VKQGKWAAVVVVQHQVGQVHLGGWGASVEQSTHQLARVLPLMTAVVLVVVVGAAALWAVVVLPWQEQLHVLRMGAPQLLSRPASFCLQGPVPCQVLELQLEVTVTLRLVLL
jgi:hypothetical protein